MCAHCVGNKTEGKRGADTEARDQQNFAVQTGWARGHCCDSSPFHPAVAPVSGREPQKQKPSTPGPALADIMSL